MDETILVPMPHVTDPNAPEMASGSINYSMNEHPVKHGPTYGGLRASAVVNAPGEGDRSQWTKRDWRELAAAYELPISGNLAELSERVKAYEVELAAEEAAKNEEEV